MSDLVFSAPWWLLGSLVIVGAVVFWSGNNRQQSGPKSVGIGLMALAVLLFVVSLLVETDKEKVTRHTNELVTAVQNRDWKTFTSLLDEDVSLGTPNGSIFSNRDALVAGAKADTDNYNLTNVSAHVTGVEQDATGITVDIDAWSEQTASMGYRVPSSWKLFWDRDGKDWRLHEVTCLRIGNEKTDQIGRLIGK
jgi:hypothetical protein